MLLSPVIIAQRLTRISSHPQPCRQGSAGENRAGSRSWACDIEAAWEQAISGQDYGRSEVSRKRAGSGENSRKGSRPAVGRSQVAATSQQHGASDLFRGRPGLCRSSRGRLKPSNAAPGAGCAVIPVYRDLRQFPRGKSGVVLNVKQAGKKGSGANPASTLAKGLVPEKWQQFPKGKSHGERGDQGRWRSQRSRIGASSSEARSGRVRQAESPLQDGGVRDGASVAWADPWALATSVVREG